MSRALHMLAARPQTERELEDKLARAGFAPAPVAMTLSRLRELGYVDDGAFARQWVEERSRLRPLGRRRLAAELARKGVAAEHIEGALGAYDDAVQIEAARSLAERAMARYAGLPPLERQRRCYAFLIGRGFDHETARAALNGGGAEPADR